MEEVLYRWRAIAPRIGRDASAFHAKVLTSQPSGSVIQLDGRSESLILKSCPSADVRTGLERALEMARRNMRNRAVERTPEVLFGEGCDIVMTRAPGVTLNDWLHAGQDVEDGFRRVGAWLGAFHSDTGATACRFNPDAVLRRLDALRGRAVPEETAFRRTLAHAAAMASAARGHPTQRAGRHGDFHMRNVILAGDQVTGIDLHPVGPGPVGYDIARLLAEASQVFGDDAAPGTALCPRMTHAFLAGYRLVGPDDPGLTCLPAFRLVLDWSELPLDGRNAFQDARLTRVLTMSERLRA